MSKKEHQLELGSDWKKGHGGKREGSGRKKGSISTSTVRICDEIKEDIETINSLIKEALRDAEGVTDPNHGSLLALNLSKSQLKDTIRSIKYYMYEIQYEDHHPSNFEKIKKDTEYDWC